ncbi:MAG: hypothetical protein J6Z35_05935 [Lachnospiraceae bacterium]|nr:hypothetical protein [Lachnospiraceae bacterium]
MKKVIKTGLSVLLPVVFLILLERKAGIYFETNDDRIITEILCGVMGNRPDCHAVYVNSMLGGILSFLYRIFGEIPWYGGLLILLHAISDFVIFRGIYEKCESWAEMVCASAVCAMILLVQIYITGQIQYTSTATLLASAGYVCLISDLHSKRKLIGFVLLELIAILLRQNAMFVVQPIGGAVFAGCLLAENGWNLKAVFRKMGIWLAALAGIVLIHFVGNVLTYQGEGWDDYRRRNMARTTLFDYEGVPEYEEVKEILDRRGVTETEYRALTDYTLAKMDPEWVEEIADYARHSGDEKTLKSALRKTWEYTVQEREWGLTRAVLLLAAAALIWIIICGNFWYLCSLLGLGAAHFLVFGFLFLRGRTPARVMMPVLVSETVLLLVLMGIAACGKSTAGIASAAENAVDRKQHSMWGKLYKTIVRRGLQVGILLFCLRSAFLTGQKQYRFIVPENQSQQIYMEGAFEILDYCNSQPENRFLLEPSVLMYTRGRALETRLYLPRNGMLSHCWYAGSPVFEEKRETYFGNDMARLRVLIRAQEKGNPLENPLLGYLSKKYDCLPVLTDSFEVSFGGIYEVYSFPDTD